jgi:hypothetical protein
MTRRMLLGVKQRAEALRHAVPIAEDLVKQHDIRTASCELPSLTVKSSSC